MLDDACGGGGGIIVFRRVLSQIFRRSSGDLPDAGGNQLRAKFTSHEEASHEYSCALLDAFFRGPYLETVNEI